MSDALKNESDMRPVMFFYGDDYLIEEKLQDIKAKALSPAFADMNYNAFDAKEADIDNIISIAQTFPVMSKKRLIVINRAEGLSKLQQDSFLEYIKNPSPTTCLVFTAEKIDKRLGFFSALDKAKCLCYIKPLAEGEFPAWIRKEALRFGKKISDETIGVLLDALGNDLGDIKQELDKLTLFVGDRNNIGKEDVETVVSNSRVDTVFNLTDSIGSKDFKKAIININKLIDQKEEPVKILGMITRHFRIIWRAKGLSKKGVSPNSMASVLGVFTPRYLDGYIKQGRGFSAEGLLKIYQKLHKTDIALKSAKQHPLMIMEKLVMDLCVK